MKVLNKHIYNWPTDLQKIRKSQTITALREEHNLELVVGKTSSYAFSIVMSSDEMTIGRMVLPVNKYSDMEVHEGDEVINVLKGRLVVNIFSDEENTNPDSVSRSCYEIETGEKMLIPAGYRHMYKNLDDVNVEAMIVIAPKL